MVEVTSYRATVTREDGYWLAEVPDVPGAHAYARTLAKLRHELADAVILAADLEDDVQVSFLFDVSDDAVEPVEPALADAFAVAAERFELAVRERALADRATQLAEQLTQAGWSVRDVAGALDVTPGRISQITHVSKLDADPVPESAEVQRMRESRATARAAKAAPSRVAAKSAAARTSTRTTATERGRITRAAKPAPSRAAKQ